MRRRSARAVRLLVLFALIVAATLQTGPVTTAVASTVADCRGPIGQGCVELRITPISDRPVVPGSAIREIQMNVCHSGYADCWQPDDRSTTEAAQVIAVNQPTVVTLNEICAADIIDDTSPVPAAMIAIARRQHDSTVFALFAPAIDHRTGQPYRCTSGDLYGIGIVGRGIVGAPIHHHYQAQIPGDAEQRVMVCAPVDSFDMCTTHLADDGLVAPLQCQELMNPNGFISDYRRTTDDRPTLIGGDLNMRDMTGCAPPGWAVTGDGIVQHVLADGLHLVDTRVVPMHFTDHPALIVDLTAN